MKKILILTLTLLMSLSVFGRHRENPAVVDKRVTDWVINQFKEMGYTVLPEVIVQDTLNRSKSNYEKYWEAKNGHIEKQKPEFDDLYYLPSKDAPKVKKHRRSDVDQIVDTLVKYNPEIKVTYEYNYDPFFYSYNIGRFYHSGFNYWMYSSPWYYSNWMYDPYDWYWDMRFSGYPYWNYPYYGGFYFGYNNFWFGHNNWWHAPYYHNNYYYNTHNKFYSNNQQSQYGRRERPSNLSSYQTENRRIAPQNRAAYQENRRTYTPTYERPRMSKRPQYNNSRVNSFSNREVAPRTESRTQTSTFNRTLNTQRSTQSRTYSAPTRSYNESRSYNNGGSDRRSSGSYGGGSNYSGGSSYSAPRSSGGSNFSSGRSSSGGGSRSSGSGSSGSGRR